eukprot:gene3320-3822_t
MAVPMVQTCNSLSLRPSGLPAMRQSPATRPRYRCACGRGYVVFGDADGTIRLVDRSWHVETFQAYNGAPVSHMKYSLYPGQPPSASFHLAAPCLGQLCASLPRFLPSASLLATIGMAPATGPHQGRRIRAAPGAGEDRGCTLKLFALDGKRDPKGYSHSPPLHEKLSAHQPSDRAILTQGTRAKLPVPSSWQ